MARRRRDTAGEASRIGGSDCERAAIVPEKAGLLARTRDVLVVRVLFAWPKKEVKVRGF